MSIVSKAVLLVSLGIFTTGSAVAQQAPAQQAPAQKPATNPGQKPANPTTAQRPTNPTALPAAPATNPQTGVKPAPSGQRVAQAPGQEKFEMHVYQMVFLKLGPNRNQDSATAAGLQTGHLNNIKRLAREGKIVVAGPFGDKGDIRGIFIMDVPTAEEAKRLCDTDPAIISGRLAVEIRPWYGPKGLTYNGKEESLAY